MESIYKNNDHADAELVQRWLKGEEAAFAALYKRYALRLLGKAQQMIRSKELARELVQEVFMELYVHRHSLEPGAGLEGYLFTILRNKMLNHQRRMAVDQKYQDHLRLKGEQLDTGTGESIENKELKEKIDSVIRQMPPQCRNVFLLKRNEHLPNKEIAQRLNISVNTVEQHVRKARNILRKSLGDYELAWWSIFFLQVLASR